MGASWTLDYHHGRRRWHSQHAYDRLQETWRRISHRLPDYCQEFYTSGRGISCDCTLLCICDFSSLRKANLLYLFHHNHLGSHACGLLCPLSTLLQSSQLTSRYCTSSIGSFACTHYHGYHLYPPKRTTDGLECCCARYWRRCKVSRLFHTVYNAKINSHIIAGNIIAKLGIKYTYIISFAVLSPLVIMMYLFVWETTYTGKRPDPMFGWDGQEAHTHVSTSSSPPRSPTEKDSGDIKHLEQLDTIAPISSPSISAERLAQQNEPKKTFREQIVVFRGRITDRSWASAFFQPFPLMIFPSVLFSSIVNGACMTWLFMSGLISFQVLLYPPYSLQPDTLAYIGLPGSLVGLISAVTAGLLNDWLIKKLSKANNGVYEPEFRLLAMIPATIFTTIGFYLLGPAYEQKYPVIKLVALSLFFHLGAPFAISACLTYIFDTQGASSKEAFVATSLFQSIFIFIATMYVPAWFAKVGPRYCFNSLAILNLVFSSLTIPMYIFGKRFRGAVSLT
jgi:hypothetical protein